jgi:hypothetical protein
MEQLLNSLAFGHCLFNFKEIGDNLKSYGPISFFGLLSFIIRQKESKISF